MKREPNKHYVYQLNNGLLLREATAAEVSEYEQLNANRKSRLVLCKDGIAIDKFLGDPVSYAHDWTL